MNKSFSEIIERLIDLTKSGELQWRVGGNKPGESEIFIADVAGKMFAFKDSIGNPILETRYADATGLRIPGSRSEDYNDLFRLGAEIKRQHGQRCMTDLEGMVAELFGESIGA